MIREHKNDNIYDIGTTIFANERPSIPLLIRRYIDRIYYCIDETKPDEGDHVYFERQISLSQTSKV